MIRERLPSKRIVVYVPAQSPQRAAAVELRTTAHKAKTLPQHLLAKAQFPATIPDGVGEIISKSASW